MRCLLAVVVLSVCAGCKESPEAAAKRIRETMVAMQDQQREEAIAKSEAMFGLLNKHASGMKDGTAESDIHKLLGKPHLTRLQNDGTVLQAWSGKSGKKSVTLGLRIRDGKAEQIKINTTGQQ